MLPSPGENIQILADVEVTDRHLIALYNMDRHDIWRTQYVSTSYIKDIAKNQVKNELRKAINKAAPVGSIQMSLLDEAAFITEAGNEWALADGRDVRNTAYERITGHHHLPDLRGAYLRMAGTNQHHGHWQDGGTLGEMQDCRTSHPAKNPFTGGTDNQGAHSHKVTVEEAADHDHNADVAATGNHSHAGTTENAGAHNHTAASEVDGRHHHDLSIQGDGNHYHSLGTFDQEDADMVQQYHNYTGASPSPAMAGKHKREDISDAGNWSEDQTAEREMATSTDGQHTHSNSIALSGGDHDHKITVHSATPHKHDVVLAAAGEHTHPTLIEPGGAHSHPESTTTTSKSHAHVVTTHEGGDAETRPQTYVVNYFIKIN